MFWCLPGVTFTAKPKRCARNGGDSFAIEEPGRGRERYNPPPQRMRLEAEQKWTVALALPVGSRLSRRYACQWGGRRRREPSVRRVGYRRQRARSAPRRRSCAKRVPLARLVHRLGRDTALGHLMARLDENLERHVIALIVRRKRSRRGLGKLSDRPPHTVDRRSNVRRWDPFGRASAGVSMPSKLLKGERQALGGNRRRAYASSQAFEAAHLSYGQPLGGGTEGPGERVVWVDDTGHGANTCRMDTSSSRTRDEGAEALQKQGIGKSVPDTQDTASGCEERGAC